MKEFIKAMIGSMGKYSPKVKSLKSEGLSVFCFHDVGEDYSEFKKYFDENQQIEILAIISLFGFLNRWNSSLMTEIESLPSTRMKEIE